jgi:hypothetical protein
VIEQWRWEYNTQRPHSSLDYRTPREFGDKARAAMTQMSRMTAIIDPAAAVEVTIEEVSPEVHPITPGNLS